MSERGPVIEIAHVAKQFEGCVAVARASVTFSPGEIHAVVGENGAGKSTLLKLASGMIAPSSGTVKIEGTALSPATPAEAARRNVRMVHQHFMLVGAFTALENLLLGNEATTSGGRLDLARARREVSALAKKTGLAVPLDAITDSLGVGEKQRLEILRVLYRGAKALLLDEPTAVLTPLEANDLYATLRALADEGRTIVVVTHRLDEVARFADRVTVMRRGRTVMSRSLGVAKESQEGEGASGAPYRKAGAATVEELTRAIMGQEPPPAFSPPEVAEDAAIALDVAGLSFTDAGGRTWLDGVDLSVKQGEIVGIAGVEGNGQRELVHAIAGLLQGAKGRLAVGETTLDLDENEVRAVGERRAVLRVVHEDRHSEGLMLDASVADNLVLGAQREIRKGREPALVARLVAELGIVPADPARLAGDLSGGNQQKIVVGRALDGILGMGGKGKLLVLAQPTRGVDVGAAAAIHEAIGRAAAKGLGVLVVSADLSELRVLCHRLLVMRKGRIVAAMAPSTPEETIGRAMLGLEAA